MARGGSEKMAKRENPSKKQNNKISDKVPKTMLRSKSELPVKQQSARLPDGNRRNIRNAPPGSLQRRAAQGGQPLPNRQPAHNDRQRPPHPMDPKAQRAVSRAMSSKSAPKRKRRYRGGNYILYYILAAIVVVIVMIVLSNTVLFRCNEIEVSGNVRYTAEEIIKCTALKTGDNLLHADVTGAANNIVKSLAYIDSAKVERSFPTKFTIAVSEAERWYGVKQNGVIAVVSRKGKIIEQGNADGLVVVKGYDAESIETGTWLKSKTDGKNDIPEIIFTAAEKAGLDKINEVDMTDRFSVKMTVDNRIVLELGPAVNVESKLRVAQALIKNELGKEESVTIILTNPEKVAVRNNPSSSAVKPSGPSSSNPVTSEPVTGETSSSEESPEEPITAEPSEPTAEEPPPETEEPGYGTAETGETGGTTEQ